jgi:hypothetical protein
VPHWRRSLLPVGVGRLLPRGGPEERLEGDRDTEEGTNGDHEYADNSETQQSTDSPGTDDLEEDS